MQDTRAATSEPKIYKSLTGADTFEGLHDAFEHYHRRLLVLGQPGAGKSTGLLHLAQGLVDKAKRDPDAPLPLIVNLSQFRFDASPPRVRNWLRRARDDEPRRDRRFEDWLAEEMLRPGVSRATTRRWIEEERVAVLLDGLDEVNDERRGDLTRLLNTTFLSDRSRTAVVVCSRIDEYRPLQDQADTRLQLSGAITLQPLNDAQIRDYLNCARATDLAAALDKDPTLLELAQSPLNLSIMALAYSGPGAKDIPTGGSLTERRHALMATFVERMLQRKERRDRNIPLDQAIERAVATENYCFSPRSVDRHLGWFAVQMSLRMQTVCRLRGFHAFMTMDRKVASRADPMLVAAQALFLALLGVCLALAVVPFEGGQGLLALTIALAPALLIGPVRWGQARFAKRGWADGVAGVATWAVAAAAAGLWAHALGSSLSRPVQLWPLGVLAMGLAAVLLCCAGFAGAAKDARPVLAGFLAVSVVATVLGFLVGSLDAVAVPAETVAAILMVIGQASWVGWVVYREDGPGAGAAAAGVILGLAMTPGVGLLLGELHWAKSFALLAAVILLIAALDSDSWRWLIGLTVAAVVGAIVHGHAGALLGASAFGLAAIIGLALQEGLKLKWVEGTVEDLDAAVDRWLLSPLLRRCHAAARHLPWRTQAFVDYAAQALLLKRARKAEVQFVHGRLRDYFALRELLPRLADTDPARRLQAVAAMGFQGAAAIDALAELVHGNGPLELRVTAVEALHRIAAPEVTDHLQLAFERGESEIRRSVVRHLQNLPKVDASRLLDAAVDDPDPGVARSAVAPAFEMLLKYDAAHLADKLLKQLPDDGELLRELAIQVDRVPDAAIYLGHRPPDWVAGILPALAADPDPTVRRGSLALAKRWRSPSMMDICIELLRRDHLPAVRKLAALVLSEVPDERAFDVLSESLNDADAEVRGAVATALGALSGDAALDLLIRALRDRSPSARAQVVKALSFKKDPRLLDEFLAALKDRNAGVREQAAAALGRLGDTRAVDPLLAVLSNRAAEVVAKAAQALGRLHDKRAAEALIKLLRHRDWHVRVNAGEALGALGDPRAVVPLMQALENGQDDAWIRGAYAESLASLGDLRAIAPLRKMLASVPDGEKPRFRKALEELEQRQAA